MKGRANTAVSRRTICLIGLGSNLGARESNIRFAVERIRRLPSTELLGTSALHRTKAVGPGRQPDYFNAAVRIRTGLSPMGLLIELKRIEALRGRKSGKRWRPASSTATSSSMDARGSEAASSLFPSRALGRASSLALLRPRPRLIPPLPRLSVRERLIGLYAVRENVRVPK